jgi:hypothetical protein
MLVIRKVLHSIIDDVTLSSQLPSNPALADLMLAFNSVIMDELLSEEIHLQEEVYPVSGDSLGVSLKDGMSHLPVKVQHRLLNTYLHKSETLQHFAHPRATDNHAAQSEEDILIEREERKLKHWLMRVKIIATISASVSLIILGAIVAIMVKDNKLPDNALVSTLMGAATEIIKVVFNSK